MKHTHCGHTNVCLSASTRNVHKHNDACPLFLDHTDVCPFLAHNTFTYGHHMAPSNEMDKAGPANRELCLTRSFPCEKKTQPPLSLQDLIVLLAGNGAKHWNHDLTSRNGWTAALVSPAVQVGTNLVSFFLSFGLSPGQVPLLVKEKSLILETSASSMVLCMKRSSPQVPYFQPFLHTSVFCLQHPDV